MIAIWPVLVMLAGLIVYFAVEKNGKISEVARIAYAFGLLVTLLTVANHTVRFLH